MMENGADLRSLQIYTHVSIDRLRQVHQQTHLASCDPPPKPEDEA